MRLAGRIAVASTIALLLVGYSGFSAWRSERSAKIELEDRIAPNNQPFLMAQSNQDIIKLLGSPASDIVYASYASLSYHENAIMVWLQPLGKIIRLNINESSSYQSYDDINGSNDIDLFDDTLQQKILGLPKECLPPIGGVAALARRNPSEWKSIGCRKWLCQLKHIRYQEFSNGLVINGLPKFPNANINQLAIMTTRLDKNRTINLWKVRTLPFLANNCIL